MFWGTRIKEGRKGSCPLYYTQGHGVYSSLNNTQVASLLPSLKFLLGITWPDEYHLVSNNCVIYFNAQAKGDILTTANIELCQNKVTPLKKIMVLYLTANINYLKIWWPPITKEPFIWRQSGKGRKKSGLQRRWQSISDEAQKHESHMNLCDEFCLHYCYKLCVPDTFLYLSEIWVIYL